jgi:hypothetical protein
MTAALAFVSLLAAVPALYWDRPIDTAEALRMAGIRRVVVPAAAVGAWRAAGFAAEGLDGEGWQRRAQAESPGIDRDVSVLSPTRSPFVVANGWRFLRAPSAAYRYQARPGAAALAAAEAFAYDVDALVMVEPSDLESFASMLRFFEAQPPESGADVAQVGVVDDGSDDIEDVMALLSRRNLLFRPLAAPSPRFRINVRLGSKDYPRAAARDPNELAHRIRGLIGDDHRLVRIYGTEAVICRVTRAGSRLRVRLINYGGGVRDGLRIRVLGAFPRASAVSDAQGSAALTDHVVAGGVTEVTMPPMRVSAILDLDAGRASR